MQFSVTLGDILNIAATVITVVAAYVRLSDRLIKVETQVEPMWHEHNSQRQRERRARRDDA